MKKRPTLTGRALFRAIAPNLERAHRQRQVELAILSERRREARRRVLHKEQLVAHRELQLVRAGATRRAVRDPKYMRQRQQKLQQAIRERETAEEALVRAIEADTLRDLDGR